MNIIQRAKAPTPPFFKKLRNISLVLAAIGTSIVAGPVALPAVVIQVAGYLTVAAAVAGSVSQVATTEDDEPEKDVFSGSAFSR